MPKHLLLLQLHSGALWCSCSPFFMTQLGLIVVWLSRFKFSKWKGSKSSLLSWQERGAAAVNSPQLRGNSLCATSPSQSPGRCSPSHLSSSAGHTEPRAAFLTHDSQIWAPGNPNFPRLSQQQRARTSSSGQRGEPSRMAKFLFAKIRTRTELLLAKLGLKRFPSSRAAAIRTLWASHW